MLGGRRVGTHRSLHIAKRARRRVRAVRDDRGDRGGQRAVRAAARADRGGAAGGQRGRVQARRRARAWRARRSCGCWRRAGLPEGLVAIAHGGAQVGVALARAPVGKVLFTGSPAVGRAVARECVSREREVTVELGGKDAMLVLADADLARAVDGALWAGCAGAGQARGAVERVYVAREVAEPFMAGLVARARGLRVGDPSSDPRVQVGAARLRAAAGARERAGRRGGGAGRAAALRRPARRRRPGCAGAFYAPAVLTGVTHEMRLMREPLDGPGAGGHRGRLGRARRSRWPTTASTGSGASVWTADRYRGARIARELHAGMVWLQRPPAGAGADARTVGRGEPAAGSGKTLGETGLRACAQEKLIAWEPVGRCADCGGGPTTRRPRGRRERSRSCAPGASATASGPGGGAARRSCGVGRADAGPRRASVANVAAAGCTTL